MSLSPDHSGSPEFSQNPENREVSSSSLAASSQASQINQPGIISRDPPNPEMEDLSGVPRNENENSLETLSGHPIQGEQNNGEASQNEATANTYENCFGGKTRCDAKNENALANSTGDETKEASSLKSGLQDQKSQNQQYDNSNGSSKPSKQQPRMSLSPDHSGSPEFSQNPENREVSSSSLAASSQASQINQPGIISRDPPNPEMEDLSGVPRNENENSLETLSGHPIQGEQNNGEASQNEATANTYENCFVSEKIFGDKFLLDKLAVRLDRTPNRSIKNWEHLACTKKIAAPPEVRLKCKLRSEKKYTMMVFDVVTAGHHKTVRDLMDALTRMERQDVRKIITDVFPDAPNSSQELSEFIASPDNVNVVADIATLLDQTSNVNKCWEDLGREFGVSSERLEEIKYGQSTQVLMEYLYTEKPDLTIGTFHEVIENDLKRMDVSRILTPFVEEEGGRDKLMKDAIPLESDIMRSICVRLNKPNTAVKNWRHLAKSTKLGIPDEVYMDCKPDKLKSPTEGLLEWATANRSDLKIGELCCALKSIGRNDIVGYIAEYFQQQSSAVQQH
ncbi:uncharacterized protein [Montipora capricornis]